MEQNNGIKITNISNLPTLNIKSQLNMNIDSNAHIKQILNIETCLIESSIEPMIGKALVKGVIGVKVVYVDTDNIFNTLSDTISFSETINSENLNSDCQINITNNQFIADFDNDENSLHINIDGAIECFCNFNSTLPIVNDNIELITRKTTLNACSCIQKIYKNTTYDYDFKLDSKISKMLSANSKIVVEETKCYEGYILISGSIINTIICEIEGEPNFIKLINNSTPFKCEVEASACDKDCFADTCAYINLNSTQISTNIGDNSTEFNFEYCVVVNSCVYKNINIDTIDDAYSTKTSVELIVGKHKTCKKSPYIKTIENIDAEITLADELNIDEILGMVNTSATITQRLVKDGVITIEGVVSGNLIYLDENKNINHLLTQLPYSINLKQDIQGDVCGMQLLATPVSCKCKIKRGNALMIDYELCVSGSVYTISQISLIENIKYGKDFEYGDIAFQVYVARPNENMWELCKRLHITQEQLIEYNKETPTNYVGGEKVVVYR